MHDLPLIVRIIQPIMWVIGLAAPIFGFAMIFSPKLRAKFMGHQLKSTKYMLDQNEELLKELNTKSANVSKEGIEIKARAMKNGFGPATNYCSSCGERIDTNSKFCKYCGEKQ